MSILETARIIDSVLTNVDVDYRIKYNGVTDEGGRLLVLSSPTGRQIHITVEDMTEPREEKS